MRYEIIQKPGDAPVPWLQTQAEAPPRALHPNVICDGCQPDHLINSTRYHLIGADCTCPLLFVPFSPRYKYS